MQNLHKSKLLMSEDTCTVCKY